MEVDISGPHPIKAQSGFRPLNFVALASTGLIEYMRGAQVTRPPARIGDEINDQSPGCTSACMSHSDHLLGIGYKA